MQAAINYANSLETDKITTPALFIYSEQDQVVDTIEIENKLKSWGGAVTVAKRVMSNKDDPQSHVIAGDIRSPTQTKDTVEIIVNWVKKL